MVTLVSVTALGVQMIHREDLVPVSIIGDKTWVGGHAFSFHFSGRGICCEGMCTCDLSPVGNRYRGEPGGVDRCQCEPMEEACMDPDVSA